MKYLFIQGGGDEQTAIVISRVALDTPADFAELHEGDQILSINQINIESLSHEEVRSRLMMNRRKIIFDFVGCEYDSTIT